MNLEPEELFDFDLGFLGRQWANRQEIGELVSRCLRRSAFASHGAGWQNFSSVGLLYLPYTSFGARNSLDLFRVDDLFQLIFYIRNREGYDTFLDVGANIGLHTIVAKASGLAVKAFEPDPETFSLLERNVGARWPLRLRTFSTSQLVHLSGFRVSRES